MLRDTFGDTFDKIKIKVAVMQTEKEVINDCLRVSKVS